MADLTAAYEDEMDERYAVRSDDEYERQHYRELHAERMALLHGSLCHTAIADALPPTQGEA